MPGLDELVTFMQSQVSRDALTLDLLALGFDHVAADLDAAGVDAARTRTFADHLHGLALEFTVGSPS